MSISNPDLTFLSGANSGFIRELYKKWQANPKSVSENWANWFEASGYDELDEAPSWGNKNDNGLKDEIFSIADNAVTNGTKKSSEHKTRDTKAETIDSIRAIMLIRSYRIRGHLLANLDPLNIHEKNVHPELDPKTYGFVESDYDKPIFIDNVLGIDSATLREIMEILEETYCGSIGVEFMHIQDMQQKTWIQERIESIRNSTQFTENGKRAIHERLVSAEVFEKFLHKKYPGTKRFGLDGSESVLPAIEQILKRGSQLGLKEVVIGMAHRGRLNVLHNVLNKPFRAIISEFLGKPSSPEDLGMSGDVKYHLGASSDRNFDQKKVHLSLQANPSHLEAVSPVIVGRVRAKQDQLNQKDKKMPSLGIILHGDAAFAGQGIVAETFDFSDSRGFRTGGNIHIIINNQIGFTTNPKYTRISPYCTDVAKKVLAPIFHVNGDDAEAVVHVARIATEYRQRFRSDVVIDVISYRRFGHSEGDEPAFTQPKMYRTIANHPSTSQIYTDKLISEGVLDRNDYLSELNKKNEYLENEFKAGSIYEPEEADWLSGEWSGLKAQKTKSDNYVTSFPIRELMRIGEAVSNYPKNFTLNKKLLKILEQRKEMVKKGDSIDWSMAEHLAFGSLLLEGHPIRLSGQDSCRGTFSQRHAVFVDQKNEKRYVPLNNLKSNQKNFEIIDSPLSEAAVLAFEYGYSVTSPSTLVLWEAQFGDFANGAQVIIDQFISSGESKWLRFSGLIMLLPHGYEGQGPEHSSARLERYLQLCAEDNIQVVNCSTPANYFHVLRRQLKSKHRKPLIIMTPKSLLRNKKCTSKLEEMSGKSNFRKIIIDSPNKVQQENIKKIVICSGKLFYDLHNEIEKQNESSIKLVRIEQLYPFPEKEIYTEIKKSAKAEIIWAQEEPENMGAWFFIKDRMERILKINKLPQNTISFVGRDASASPATGSMSTHNHEQKNLIKKTLNLKT